MDVVHIFNHNFVMLIFLKTNIDLALKQSSFHYFNAHEEKNISDAVGSIARCAFIRPVCRRKVEGIENAAEVVDIINANLAEDMPKFRIMKAVHFPRIERIPANERPAYPFDNIMTAHSITVRSDGLIADQLSCLSCTVSTTCPVCMEMELVVENPEAVEAEEEEDIQDEEDEGCTDDESDMSDNEQPFNRGDIVWAKYGKLFYPAKVVGKKDVPIEHHRQLFSGSSDKHAVVMWYGEDKYSRVLVSKITLLAESREDAKRATNQDILLLYNLALADLRND